MNEHQLDANTVYTVKELGYHWNMSSDSVIRLMENEPGVLIFKIQNTGRRVRRIFRIPGRVALRVQNRMTVVNLK